MKLDVLHTTLGYAYLQRDLLAVQAPSLEAAIRAGNEYLQIKPIPQASSVAQQVVVVEAKPLEAARQDGRPMEAIMKDVMKLTEELGTLKGSHKGLQIQVSRREPKTDQGGPRCFGCQKK